MYNSNTKSTRSSGAPSRFSKTGGSHSGTKTSAPRSPGYSSSPRTGSGYSGGSSSGYRPSSGGSSTGYRTSAPRFGMRSGGYSGGSGRSGGRPMGRGGRGGGRMRARIDVSKFINRVVETAHVTKNEFVPNNTFAEFNISDKLKVSIADRGLLLPTPIQDAAIPVCLEGKDVVGIANTGTGKTLAFLLPLLNKIIHNPKEKILIMAPTRELAIQIDDELHKISKGTGAYSVCCVGGAPIGRQMSGLRYFNHFIIGTPGRLKDLAERGYIKFEEFNSVVLDEADRMLDMGFINEMKFMLGKMPATKQTLFFTATMSPEVHGLIHQFMKNPIVISTKVGDTSKLVDQDVVRVGAKIKIDLLHDLLIHADFKKVLIFGETKHGVERLSNELVKRGFKAGSIHGDKNHSQRQRTLKMFKDGLLNILVATDVAARGLDIPDVSHVINYEIPMTYEDYVHRIGRTGRAGKTGKALTFVA